MTATVETLGGRRQRSVACQGTGGDVTGESSGSWACRFCHSGEEENTAGAGNSTTSSRSSPSLLSPGRLSCVPSPNSTTSSTLATIFVTLAPLFFFSTIAVNSTVCYRPTDGLLHGDDGWARRTHHHSLARHPARRPGTDPRRRRRGRRRFRRGYQCTVLPREHPAHPAVTEPGPLDRPHSCNSRGWSCRCFTNSNSSWTTWTTRFASRRPTSSAASSNIACAGPA